MTQKCCRSNNNFSILWPRCFRLKSKRGPSYYFWPQLRKGGRGKIFGKSNTACVAVHITKTEMKYRLLVCASEWVRMCPHSPFVRRVKVKKYTEKRKKKQEQTKCKWSLKYPIIFVNALLITLMLTTLHKHEHFYSYLDLRFWPAWLKVRKTVAR